MAYNLELYIMDKGSIHILIGVSTAIVAASIIGGFKCLSGMMWRGFVSSVIDTIQKQSIFMTPGEVQKLLINTSIDPNRFVNQASEEDEATAKEKLEKLKEEIEGLKKFL